MTATASCHGDAGAATVVGDGGVVALVGAPNTGKSSVFNHLTGLRVRTANYPGVTVTRTLGTVRGSTRGVVVVDLPGTYGLEPVSPDEAVVADHLAGRLPGVAAPDALLVVVDATTLHRSLPLVGEALGTGRPGAVVLTMTDELRARGGDVDARGLSDALGVPVHEVVGHRGLGTAEVRAALDGWHSWPGPPFAPPTGDDPGVAAWVASVAQGARYRAPGPPAATRGIDRVVLHPVGGVAVLLAVMVAFFQVVFTVAAPLQGLVETAFAALGAAAADAIGPPLLADLVGTALIGGVGGVLVFLPQIVLLVLVLSLLEGVGYLARAAVLMDRVMALTGLDGRAFVAMLSSVACAVPGILATRTMASSRDRIATMLAAPVMPCSARLPVYVLLVGMLVPPDAGWGPFGAQGLAMFALYLAGGLSAMVVASVLRATVLRSVGQPFYLELPPYRVPTLTTVAHEAGAAAWRFVRKAGTIILGATVVLWALMTFPAGVVTSSDPGARAAALDASWAADLGRAVEPVFEPLGFDWRVDVGLLGSLAAREVFVSTLGQVAAAEDPEDPAGALEELTWQDGPRAGERVLTTPTLVALGVYFVYAMQCISTLAVLRRESNTWRWPVVAFVGLNTLAWLMAWLARGVTVLVTG